MAAQRPARSEPPGAHATGGAEDKGRLLAAAGPTAERAASAGTAIMIRVAVQNLTRSAEEGRRMGDEVEQADGPSAFPPVVAARDQLSSSACRSASSASTLTLTL